MDKYYKKVIFSHQSITKRKLEVMGTQVSFCCLTMQKESKCGRALQKDLKIDTESY